MVEVTWLFRSGHVLGDGGLGSRRERMGLAAQVASLSSSVSLAPQHCHGCSKTHLQYVTPVRHSQELNKDRCENDNGCVSAIIPRPRLRQLPIFFVGTRAPDPYGEVVLWLVASNRYIYGCRSSMKKRSKTVGTGARDGGAAAVLFYMHS